MNSDYKMKKSSSVIQAKTDFNMVQSDTSPLVVLNNCDIFFFSPPQQNIFVVSILNQNITHS